MARRVHAAGVRERQNMRRAAADRAGKFDVGWRDGDGWHHVCRYSDESEARAAANTRLPNFDEEERALIGFPEDAEFEVLSVK